MTNTKTHTKPLVPQLRFKEFDDEWEKKKLGDISSKVAYGMNSAAITFDGKHKYLRITDIDEDSREFKSDSLTSPDGLIEDKFKMKLNDIVFARTGASTGKSYLYNPKDGNLYYAGFLIKFNIAKADSYFVYSQTFRESYRKWVQVYSMRSGQPGLNAEEYKNLKFAIPSLKEQQKIAAFLTAVDDKISQLTRKKELLAQYKKGVMQQLFPSTGSGQVPELRFQPEGSTTSLRGTKQSASNENQFPDWEEKRLGEVGKIVSGLTYSPNDIVNEDNGVLVLRSSNVQDGKLAFDDNVYVKVDSFNAVQRNDILICVRNGSKRLIGKNAIINEKVEGVAFGAFMSVYRSENNSFLFHYFGSEDYNREVQKNLGATINSINGSDLKKFKVPFPSLKEQQKIASYLSALDDKIEAVQLQIEQTSAFKKGLLQQLFV